MTTQDERLTPFMIFFCEMKPAILENGARQQSVTTHACTANLCLILATWLFADPSLQPVEVSKLVLSQWKTLSEAQSRGYSVLSATYTLKKDSGIR